jgi:DMSO reductase anchor subunit
MHQLSLVFFTVLIQASTGLLLFSGIQQFKSIANGQPRIPINNLGFQIILWTLFTMGALASLLHLGKPSNALNVLYGIQTGSPLSLEVLIVGFFGTLLLIYSLLTWKKAQIQKYNFFLGLTILAGLMVSYATARVYTLPTIPAWNSTWTLVQFFMSVLALGSVGFLFFQSQQQEKNSSTPQTRTAIIILFLLMANIVFYNKWSNNIILESGLALPSWNFFIPRIILLVTSFVLLLFSGKKNNYASQWTYTLIFVCVLASELAGRIDFYNLQKISGMLQIFAY